MTRARQPERGGGVKGRKIIPEGVRRTGPRVNPLHINDSSAWYCSY